MAIEYYLESRIDLAGNGSNTNIPYLLP